MPRDRRGVRGRGTTTKSAAARKRALSPARSPSPPAKRPRGRKPFSNRLPATPEHPRPGFQLFGWGSSNFGQLGLGPNTRDDITEPKKHSWAEKQMENGAFGDSAGAGLEDIAAGGMHSLFIDEKGTIWSCGVNDDAALGRVTKNVPDPQNPGSFIEEDELATIPHPLQSLVDEGFRAAQVAAGDSIGAAVSDQGDLKVWGSFRVTEGFLGFSDGLERQFMPTSILELSHKAGNVEKVSSVAAGDNHILVLTTHGNVYSCGAGDVGQLGRKVLTRHKINGTVPQKVILGARSRKATLVGAGSFHSFAIDEDGDVWGWGLNSMGQTGTGYSSSEDSIVQLPTKVSGLSAGDLGGSDRVVEISGGEHHTLFLTLYGKMYACGRFNDGQLGLPNDDEAFQSDRAHEDFLPDPVLVKFPTEDPVIHISVGARGNMALTRDGALFSWGCGHQGELGVPEEVVRTPTMIVQREGGPWAAIKVSCGGQHTLGLFRKRQK